MITLKEFNNVMKGLNRVKVDECKMITKLYYLNLNQLIEYSEDFNCFVDYFQKPCLLNPYLKFERCNYKGEIKKSDYMQKFINLFFLSVYVADLIGKQDGKKERGSKVWLVLKEYAIKLVFTEGIGGISLKKVLESRNYDEANKIIYTYSLFDENEILAAIISEIQKNNNPPDGTSIPRAPVTTNIFYQDYENKIIIAVDRLKKDFRSMLELPNVINISEGKKKDINDFIKKNKVNIEKKRTKCNCWLFACLNIVVALIGLFTFEVMSYIGFSLAILSILAPQFMNRKWSIKKFFQYIDKRHEKLLREFDEEVFGNP